MRSFWCHPCTNIRISFYSQGCSLHSATKYMHRYDYSRFVLVTLHLSVCMGTFAPTDMLKPQNFPWIRYLHLNRFCLSTLQAVVIYCIWTMVSWDIICHLQIRYYANAKTSASGVFAPTPIIRGSRYSSLLITGIACIKIAWKLFKVKV